MTNGANVSPFACDQADSNLDDEVIQQPCHEERVAQDTIERRLESMVRDAHLSSSLTILINL